MGLGLPLVVSILAVYGAELTVESEGVGRGTVATVRWPLESVTGDGRAKTPAS